MTGGTMIRAGLYGRVSTQEQAQKGYSIDGQLSELRPAVEGMGRTIAAEIVDAGYSRDNIERPGIDELLDLAADGAIDEAWAWKWDRYGASPVPEVLAAQLADSGVTLRSLDDSGEGDDAEFMNGIKSLISKRELRDMVRRTRTGRLEKARRGLIVATGLPDYGFRFNETRDGYVVDEEKMPVVRRIFREIAGGSSLNSLVQRLNREDIAPPGGSNGKSGKWNIQFITNAIKDDVYKPYSHSDVRALVRPEVAERLDKAATYGIYWYNKQRVKTIKTTVSDGMGGKRQKRRHVSTALPRSEWIAIPVPDAGIPLEVVEAARVGIKDNVRPSKAGGRFWELDGAVRCGICGRAISPKRVKRPSGHNYDFYLCTYTWRNQTCTNGKTFPARKLEARVADFVTDLLSDEGRLIEQVDALIEREREALRNPEPETKAWRAKIEEYDRKRAKYQEMYAADAMTLTELKTALTDLEDLKAAAEKEQKATEQRAERIAGLERDKAALQEMYRQRALQGGLADFTPEERHKIYRRLRLTVRVYPDHAIDVDGELPLALTYLDSPLMVVGHGMTVAEDEDGYDCWEGCYTIKSGR